MKNIFISPSKYIHGPGVMHEIGEYAVKFGDSALCLISEGGYRRFGAQINESFGEADADVLFAFFNGECCRPEIDRLVRVVEENRRDVIIGVGGGKIFDTAKAVAYYAHIPVIVAPTIASTDAPCSGLSVIYSPEGVFEEYLFFPQNPNMVLMDTAVIAKSPLRLTVSGMGDAMATYFEARACCASGATTCAGGNVGVAAMGIARLCYDTLRAEGEKAKAAIEAGACTQAVERIIEANTLLSGIGFESGGLAGAHAVHNGLTKLAECHHMQHGEKVNFGTLTQLVLENMPKEELDDLLGWMIRIGLPVTFAQLGVTDTSREHLLPVGEAACADNDTMGNMPFPVTPDDVVDAMRTADRLGRAVLGK